MHSKWIIKNRRNITQRNEWNEKKYTQKLYEIINLTWRSLKLKHISVFCIHWNDFVIFLYVQLIQMQRQDIHTDDGIFEWERVIIFTHSIRIPNPSTLEVICHHLNYYRNEMKWIHRFHYSVSIVGIVIESN